MLILFKVVIGRLFPAMDPFILMFPSYHIHYYIGIMTAKLAPCRLGRFLYPEQANQCTSI